MKSFCPFSRKYISRAINGDFTGIEKEYSLAVKVVSYAVYYVQAPVCAIFEIPCFTPVVSNFCEVITRCWGRGIIGFFIRNVYWRTKFGKIGQDVFIDTGVTIFGAKNVEIGNNSHIDVGCCLICASGKIKIGNNVHIANNCVMNGKPFITIEDNVGISADCKIYGSTNYYKKENGERAYGTPMLPLSSQSVKEVGVIIKHGAFIGTDSIIIPNASIGKMAVIGANSIVNSEIKDYAIAVGNPACSRS
jgi:acetyltransferase-like isoleucine patch superfamily enzyme